MSFPHGDEATDAQDDGGGGKPNGPSPVRVSSRVVVKMVVEIGRARRLDSAIFLSISSSSSFTSTRPVSIC